MKRIPIIKKVGRTVRAVSTGCHAGKRCCLNAESKIYIKNCFIWNTHVVLKYTVKFEISINEICSACIVDIFVLYNDYKYITICLL